MLIMSMKMKEIDLRLEKVQTKGLSADIHINSLASIESKPTTLSSHNRKKGSPKSIKVARETPVSVGKFCVLIFVYFHFTNAISVFKSSFH